jgi:signal transduction histidine kinase
MTDSTIRNTLPLPPMPKFVGRLYDLLLKPRSTNRDDIFRERTLRITILIVVVASFLSLFSSTFVFQDAWSLLSPQTLQFIGLVLSIAAAVAISRQKIIIAGGFIVLFMLVAAVGVILLPQLANNGTLHLPLFMIAVLTAALLMPRNIIIPLGVLCLILLASVLEIKNPASPENQGTFWIGVFVITIEALFLRQLRVEFDDRLDNMRSLVRETELAREEAYQANHAKSQFLASMSHELRTPLNAIIGYIEIMLAGMVGTFTPQQTELQHHVHVNAKRLLSLINDILDLAKIESGKLEFVIAPANPRQLVNETLASMESLAKQKSIYLHCNYADDTPEVIMCDAKKVQQVVVNLVSNAIKFTTNGGVTVEVSTGDKTQWMMKVIDTGAGMPTDAPGYIFEKFRQVDGTSTRQHQGTGLGLAIVKSLVEGMGGKIDVETALGKGTTFVVTLPRSGKPEAIVA